MNVTERNQLIVNHLGYAEQLASMQFRKTPPSVQWDELKSAAYMGLVDAATKYDGQVDFRFFSKRRIIGEMQDYLKSRPLWGRSTHFRIRFFDNGQDHAGEPDAENFSEMFEDFTIGLGGRAKRVLYSYFAEDLTLKEIAVRMSLSPTRVHQILQAGIEELRQRNSLDNWQRSA